MNMHDPGELQMFGKPRSTDEQRCWELWRQDDNGICNLIACFEDHEAALAAHARFESQHHKQTYWIVERGTP
jgi:hypothetical protein